MSTFVSWGGGLDLFRHFNKAAGSIAPLTPILCFLPGNPPTHEDQTWWAEGA